MLMEFGWWILFEGCHLESAYIVGMIILSSKISRLCRCELDYASLGLGLIVCLGGSSVECLNI
jgi:hypothetical protein